MEIHLIEDVPNPHFMIGPFKVEREDWGLCNNGMWLRLKGGKPQGLFYYERYTVKALGKVYEGWSKLAEVEGKVAKGGLLLARYRVAKRAVKVMAKEIAADFKRRRS